MPLVVAGSAALLACSLITELDGLSKDETVVFVPVPSEGGSGDDGRAAITDAPLDTSAPDAAAKDFCLSSAHAFCADFEGPAPLAAFRAPDVAPAGSLAVSSVRSLSGQSSLHCKLPRRGDDNINLVALVSQAIPHAFARAVFELDVFIEPTAWAEGDINLAIASVAIRSSTQSETVFLTVAQDYTEIGSSSFVAAPGPPVPEGQWVHVRIEYDPAGSLGAKVGSHSFETKTFPAFVSGEAPNVKIEVGLNTFNDPIAAVSVFYDNVTLDFL